MNNIKSNAAGATWFIGLLIYFALLISIQATSGLVGENEITPYGQGLLQTSQCFEPRNVYSGNLDETREVSKPIELGSLSCRYTQGQANQNVCDAIPGCSWSESSFWFGWFQSTECQGNVDITNTSAFNITLTDNFRQGDDPYHIAMSTYQFDNILTESVSIPGSYIPLTRLDGVKFDQEVCDLFMFTWVEYGTSEFASLEQQDTDLRQTAATFSAMVNTQNIFFNTGSPVMNWILNIIFYIIPGILFAISIWFILNPFS